jgi:hypothetical protein
LWWSRLMSQIDASAGLQARRSGVQGDPWFGRCGSSARSGSAAPEEEGRDEQSSPVCSTWDQGHCPASLSCRTSGCERGRRPAQVATRLQERRSSLCCEYNECRCQRCWHRTHCVCRQSECAGESRLRAVGLLSTQIVRKQAKAIISNDASQCVTSSSTLSNSTNESVVWQAAKFGRRRRLLELAHPPTT